MAAGVFSKLIGTTLSFFQFGGPAAPGINNNSGALEAKNSSNASFVTMSGAAPTADAHFTTKAYVDSVANRPIPVSLQFNGNSSLPSNSSTEQWYLVTTTGANATIGQILWDDGSNAGTVTVLPAKIGNSCVTTVAFSGGTFAVGANQMLVWSGSSWVDIIPSVSGATYVIRLPITNAASQSSATQIPANAYVQSCLLNVTTPYSAGATMSVGQTGTPALLMATSPDNVATVAGQYLVMQDTAWGASTLALLVTVNNTPAAGAGAVTVVYTVPNA